MKKSFLLHLDSLDVLDSITDDQAWKLLKKMKAYHSWDTYESWDSLVDVVFIQFRNQFDRDLDKYDNVCKRNKAIAVRRREKAKSTKSTSGKSGVPKSTRSTDNDNDNDSDKDKEKKTLSIDKEATPRVDKRKPEVVMIIEQIKKACLEYGVIYGPDTKEYQYASYLNSKKFKKECLDVFNLDMPKFIDWIIKISSSNRYSKVCNNPKSIYYNWADVINKHKQEKGLKEDRTKVRKNLVSRENI